MNNLLLHLSAHIGMSFLLTILIYLGLRSSLFWAAIVTLMIGFVYETFEQTTEIYYFLDAFWKNLLGVILAVITVILWIQRK